MTLFLARLLLTNLNISQFAKVEESTLNYAARIFNFIEYTF